MTDDVFAADMYHDEHQRIAFSAFVAASLHQVRAGYFHRLTVLRGFVIVLLFAGEEQSS